MRPDIPQEPYTLMSWVNTKLRDQYESLDGHAERNQR